MSEHGMGTHVVTQVAIVVRDIERATEAWSKVFGLPKPEISITDAPEVAQATYCGEPTEARAKLAFFDLGQVSLELIEPVDGDSVWQEVLDERGEGVHHIAFQVKDTDHVTDFLEEHGMSVIQQGHYTGGMYTYIDSEPVLSVMLELLENFDTEEPGSA
ncbi:MAG: VOC family protein [Anaerolineae bacterium]